jgi:hypothetical protein
LVLDEEFIVLFVVDLCGLLDGGTQGIIKLRDVLGHQFVYQLRGDLAGGDDEWVEFGRRLGDGEGGRGF